MSRATPGQLKGKRRSVKRLPFARELRKLGFVRLEPDRDPLIYERENGVMKVDVQLWLEGSHRASSSVDGHHDKVPTDFKTLEEMIYAIAVEVDAADRKLRSDKNMAYRAKLIESRVKELYGVENAYAAAHDELKRNPNRSWLDVSAHLGAILVKESMS